MLEMSDVSSVIGGPKGFGNVNLMSKVASAYLAV